MGNIHAPKYDKVELIVRIAKLTKQVSKEHKICLRGLILWHTL